MLRKGMIERQVEVLSLFLSKLLKLKEEERLVEAHESVPNACKELTGLTWGLVHSLPVERLHGLLQVDGRLDAGRCATVAVLLHEQGKLEEDAGNRGEARALYRKAFVLLGTAIKQESLLDTAEMRERVGDLMRRVAAPASE